MKRAGSIGKIIGLAALLAGAACDVVAPVSPSIAPQSRPAGLAATPAPVSPQPSADSRALSVYYQRLQNDLQARGLLRTDGGGPDTAFTDTVLARNFIQIALYDEYVSTRQGLRAQATVSRLRRWEQPVRFNVQYGATVPAQQRVKDDAQVANFVSRLARVSGARISMSARNPNFHVLILNEDDRLGFEPQLRALIPGIDDASVRAFIDVPRDTLCLVLAFSQDGSPQYSQAVALIRGEHPDLMRRACIHEELAQGLGLANDSPRARPSIFNDDEEFALLTTHDEFLLKMLYDPRFRPGMSVDDATPIARVVATDLLNPGPV